MLQSMKIENFRALRLVDVPLRPLTVLIGPNDSGKSAFLAAIQYLINGIQFQKWDHWRHDIKTPIALTATTAQGTTSLGTHGSSKDAAGLVDMRPVGFFHLLSSGISLESVGSSEERGIPTINPNGDGVAAFLDYVLRYDRDRFFAILKAMRELVPGLADLVIASRSPELRRIDFVIEKDLLLSSTFSSAGVRLLMVFVALAFHPRPPKLILVEEPETGFHPKRLSAVMQLLREITEGKYSRNPAQVIVTTHSPYLLDMLNIQKDQVLVFRRRDDGSRTAEPVDAERLKPFLEEFKLGEVWFNQSEEGLVERKK
jgi:predicted ATPase